MIPTDEVELRRILALPANGPQLDHPIERLVEPTGVIDLREGQRAALVHATYCGGVMGLLSVGLGKTLVASLIPSLFPGAKAVIFADKPLVQQGVRMTKTYARAFKLSKTMKWVSYGILSAIGSSDLLEELKPELIICDEAHMLKNPHSARTKRLLRYAKENPSVKFFFLSGSFASTSILDYAHLSALALRERSPVPTKNGVAKAWANVLDVRGKAPHVGALYQLGGGYTTQGVRQAFAQRLSISPGFVIRQQVVDVPLSIRFVKTPTSEKVNAALHKLERTWERPDGVELMSPLELFRYREYLNLGGYYRWVTVPPRDWLIARSAYGRLLRQLLSTSCDEDSLGQVAIAIREGQYGTEALDTLKTWAMWRERVAEPDTEWVWEDYSYFQSLASSLVSCLQGPALWWSGYTEPGRALAKVLGTEFYNDERDPSIIEKGDRSVVLSLKKHHKGRNFQTTFHRNVLLSGLRDAVMYEQTVGRTHRSGQTKPVEFIIPHFFAADFDEACKKAKFAEDTNLIQQKILHARIER